MRDLKELQKRNNEKFALRVGFKQFNHKREIEEFTFGDLYRDTQALGTKLLADGCRGWHIAILGENSYQWVLSYITVINGVGVVIPMDKELKDDDMARLLRACDADAVISSRTYMPMLSRIRESCPNIKRIIVQNPTEEDDFGDEALAELVEAGKELLEAGRSDYTDITIDPHALCEILFTSGTTGANKGVMLSQDNIAAALYSSMSLIYAGNMCYSVLPINHSYECTCHILGALYQGSTLCFNDSLKRVVQNMDVFRPDFSLMVPQFLVSMRKMIWKKAKENGLDVHMRYGMIYSEILRKLGIDGRRLFFKPVHKQLGGNMEQIVVGGAPISAETVKEFDVLGINVVVGYGITECAPLVAANCSRFKRYGSVGQVVPSCRVRITDPDENGVGEVEVTGDNVMLGYYKDEASTAASFTADGWFKTGDLGYFDRQKYLYLAGRKKNLIILPNGKNVFPEELEDFITEKIEYVREVVVFAPADEEVICALCYLDEEYLDTHGVTNPLEQLKHDMRKVNAVLPGYKQISDVRISEHEFEKTTTAKIKRQSVVK